MALTATATSDTLKVVTERLSLDDPAVIGLSPNLPHVFYLAEKLPKLEDFCRHLSSCLMRDRVLYPKTIIFCRSYNDCGEVYRTIEIMMGPSFTEPYGYPHGLHHFRIVDMYTRASVRSMKEKILKSFASLNSKLRVVIATTAFSMGIDCPDIRKVVHFGTPGSIEEYVQETGRAGRDGQPAKACLLYGKPPKDASPKMKELILHSVVESNYLQHFYFIIETMLERIAYQNASVVTTVQSIVTVQTVVSNYTYIHILN